MLIVPLETHAIELLDHHAVQQRAGRPSQRNDVRVVDVGRARRHHPRDARGLPNCPNHGDGPIQVCHRRAHSEAEGVVAEVKGPAPAHRKPTETCGEPSLVRIVRPCSRRLVHHGDGLHSEQGANLVGCHVEAETKPRGHGLVRELVEPVAQIHRKPQGLRRLFLGLVADVEGHLLQLGFEVESFRRKLEVADRRRRRKARLRRPSVAGIHCSGVDDQA